MVYTKQVMRFGQSSEKKNRFRRKKITLAHESEFENILGTQGQKLNFTRKELDEYLMKQLDAEKNLSSV